jgi:phosphoribosylaminoimidazole-succinocarboxamide synthase
MILLQVEMQNFSNNDFFYNLEILIIIIVIALQIIHSLKLYGSVKKLRTVFEDRLTIINGYIEKNRIGESDNILSEIKFGAVESKFIENFDHNIVKLPLVQSKGDNNVITRIIETLNLYLIEFICINLL